MKSEVKRKLAGALTGAVVAVAISAVAGSPAAAEPNPCGRSTADHFSGGSRHSGSTGSSQKASVWGTWYNCGGGAGADRVRIEVAFGDDSGCINVGYRSTGSVTFTSTGFVPFKVPAYQGWVRC